MNLMSEISGLKKHPQNSKEKKKKEGRQTQHLGNGRMANEVETDSLKTCVWDDPFNNNNNKKIVRQNWLGNLKQKQKKRN